MAQQKTRRQGVHQHTVAAGPRPANVGRAGRNNRAEASFDVVRAVRGRARRSDPSNAAGHRGERDDNRPIEVLVVALFPATSNHKSCAQHEQQAAPNHRETSIRARGSQR